MCNAELDRIVLFHQSLSFSNKLPLDHQSRQVRGIDRKLLMHNFLLIYNRKYYYPNKSFRSNIKFFPNNLSQQLQTMYKKLKQFLLFKINNYNHFSL